MKEKHKRVFFAFQTEAPWPEQLPDGRILPPGCRHITVAFLGNLYFPDFKNFLPEIPKPPFKVGRSGVLANMLFLPPKRPRVAAYEAVWNTGGKLIASYHETLASWLGERGYAVSTRPGPFLSHVTVARWPFHTKEWKEQFNPIPFKITALHLYESLGGLNYQPIWSLPLFDPFEEMEHTADLAFKVRGESVEEILTNARTALAFEFPSILPYFCKPEKIHSVDDVVEALNAIVTKADMEIGAPLKAVSFHGDLKEEGNQTLSWEMIIDV